MVCVPGIKDSCLIPIPEKRTLHGFPRNDHGAASQCLFDFVVDTLYIREHNLWYPSKHFLCFPKFLLHPAGHINPWMRAIVSNVFCPEESRNFSFVENSTSFCGKYGFIHTISLLLYYHKCRVIFVSV